MTADAPMDGLSPPRPEPARYDAASGAWVLSRYDEVLAAFRDTRLWPVNARGGDDGDPRDDRGAMVIRPKVLNALAPPRLGEWQTRMEKLAVERLEGLPPGRPADLLHDFALPWCLALALDVTGADPADRERLSELGAQVFARGGSAPDSDLRPRAAAAIAELERYFASAPVPMAQPTFMGISQTLPRLLVNGWLALFRHPAEVARLRAAPELISNAVEELMRYGGIITSLYRKARVDTEVGPLRLAAGDRVTLMIASANRDPGKFPDPDRVDVTRRAAGQLALGVGHSSCAGARVVRMTHAVAITAFLNKLDRVTPEAEVSWRTGSGFCWPASVRITFEKRS